MSPRQWSRDLGLGVRFAFGGGREGWVRALLTAVGVGLGVALLLITTALPNALTVRKEREAARQDATYVFTPVKKAADTFVVADNDTEFHGADVRGRLLEPEGVKAPLPPGLHRYPAAGDMVVSPALKELLDSAAGKELRTRLPYRVSGTIGEVGLIGSRELAYYAGVSGLADRIDPPTVARLDHFGSTAPNGSEDPVMALLILVVFVVLLMPVGVFIAAAVRFGGERRDRRLAALRLVGSDSRMVRRIAAGEAMAGALLGLVFGAGFFLIARQIASSVEVFGASVFPSYLTPAPALVALVLLAVPAAAVLVTLLALRGVVIEPLGVVRTTKPARRRLWWRLLLPVAGLAALYPMIGQGDDGGTFNQYLVTGGVLLLLVGVTALLPWVVESVVTRLGTGPLSWQLAVRRLQLSSGSAARMVNGIAVAVAGAIALQMLFTGVDAQYSKQTGYDLERAQMQMSVTDRAPASRVSDAMRDTEGVRKVVAIGNSQIGDGPVEPKNSTEVSVGDCASLRELAALPSCRDGDVFALTGGAEDSWTTSVLTSHKKLYLNPSFSDEEPLGRVAWQPPKDLKQARTRTDPTGMKRSGLLVTDGALPSAAAAGVHRVVYLSLDPKVADAKEHVRDTAAGVDVLLQPETLVATERTAEFATLRTGLFVGAAAVLALIGASLLVGQLEQLRERRKLLSSLVAFGTRRRTLSLSVLWQSALPVGLGLLLAAVVGLTLGTVLLRMVGAQVRIDWAGVLAMSGFGAAVVMAVTALSLPPLLRLMRPEGLRTE
ncbi:FtsX-like permease family protein [Streptomyces sp. NPDC094437]|uniref:FtsX-like permease family protein n=1 Tax=Streptomyces sp. NPDC094437 TaxID=3366060 RepID=UPI003814875C